MAASRNLLAIEGLLTSAKQSVTIFGYFLAAQLAGFLLILFPDYFFAGIPVVGKFELAHLLLGDRIGSESGLNISHLKRPELPK